MNDLIFWISLGLASAAVVLVLIGLAYKIGYATAEAAFIATLIREKNAASREEREHFQRQAIFRGLGEYDQVSGVFQFRKPADIAIDFIERACEEKE